MKTPLVPALLTVMVLGTASTACAAANPFADVPGDHWAYEAAAQLAAHGVIEGYGDSTYRGDRHVTRYEMAQMVARAMAKSGLLPADKALLDKLTAEFGDELSSLGLRIAELESKADLVKWQGSMEYTYSNDIKKHNDGSKEKDTSNELELHLEPSAEVNDHWQVHARIDSKYEMSSDDNGEGTAVDLKLSRAWAQGDYKNFSLRFGRFLMYGEENINYTTMSGADLALGSNDKLSGTIGGGRSSAVFAYLDGDQLTKMFYVGLDYNKSRNKGFFGAARYFRCTNGINFTDDKSDERSNHIWQAMAGYNFDDNIILHGFYAKSNRQVLGGSGNSRTYNIQLNYKGAVAEDQGSWGAWAAYRCAGLAATPDAVWDVIYEQMHGWTVGAEWAIIKNTVATLEYGQGRYIDQNGDKIRQLFANVECFF